MFQKIYYILCPDRLNQKTKETKMSKTENKSGKCKNCSGMHDKCDKKMDASKSDCKK